jgi:hypothetical protein
MIACKQMKLPITSFSGKARHITWTAVSHLPPRVQWAVWILSVYHVCMSGGWPLTAQIKTRLARWRRSYVRRKFPQLFNEASAVLFRSDPIGINFEDNTDEYDPEVGTILARLSRCHSSSDARKVIFEEFCTWFGPETAGDEMRYDAIAAELWLLWSAHRANSSEPTP